MSLHFPHQSKLDLHLPPSSLAASPQVSSKGGLLVETAGILLPVLEQGLPINASVLRSAMTSVFGASDNEGAWIWKDAYEASEAAIILFLRKYLPQMRAHPGGAAQTLSMLQTLKTYLPTQTRRSDESTTLQQFSTPIDLAFLAAFAGDIGADDHVLEPSAGTGMLAIHAQSFGARLFLNELAVRRGDMLSALFPDAPLTRFNAEQIDDFLPRSVNPSVILMNPPFSVRAHQTGTARGADLLHMISAFRRLACGGRLVAITGASCDPASGEFSAFIQEQKSARLIFSAALDRGFFRAHGTGIATRLTVLDKAPQDTTAPLSFEGVSDPTHLLSLLQTHLPPREALSLIPAAQTAPLTIFTARAMPKPARSLITATSTPDPQTSPVIELSYDILGSSPLSSVASSTLYERYRLDTIRIPGAAPHRSHLVQSAAMASVRLPAPAYRPHLPERLLTEHLLSDAQLESVIQAGEAHSRYLAGRWLLNESYDALSPATDDDPAAVQFRRGWMLGDGTGVGKGRQVAAIILDNKLKGRTRALWISKNEELLEDAQRDWSDLGQERLQIILQGKYALGAPITLDEGILSHILQVSR